MTRYIFLFLSSRLQSYHIILYTDSWRFTLWLRWGKKQAFMLSYHHFVGDGFLQSFGRNLKQLSYHADLLSTHDAGRLLPVSLNTNLKKSCRQEHTRGFTVLDGGAYVSGTSSLWKNTLPKWRMDESNLNALLWSSGLKWRMSMALRNRLKSPASSFPSIAQSPPCLYSALLSRYTVYSQPVHLYCKLF